MNPMLRTEERLRNAAGVAQILDAACDAFEDMLLAIRACEDPASGWFAASMMAAASAADGRDAVLFAPSLPRCRTAGAPVVEAASLAAESAESIADAVAGLSRLLVTRLLQAREGSSDSGDRAACADAVCSAKTIHGLVSGGGP